MIHRFLEEENKSCLVQWGGEGNLSQLFPLTSSGLNFTLIYRCYFQPFRLCGTWPLLADPGKLHGIGLVSVKGEGSRAVAEKMRGYFQEGDGHQGPPRLEELPTALFGERRFPRLAVVAPQDIGALSKERNRGAGTKGGRRAGGSPRKGQGGGGNALQASARRARAKPGLPRPAGRELSEVLKGGAAFPRRRARRPSAGPGRRFPEGRSPRTRGATQAEACPDRAESANSQRTETACSSSPHKGGGQVSCQLGTGSESEE